MMRAMSGQGAFPLVSSRTVIGGWPASRNADATCPPRMIAYKCQHHAGMSVFCGRISVAVRFSISFVCRVPMITGGIPRGFH